jgi:isopentenyl diphosphate isomerase/L-lactate dehydrogenase-like FMN-dependent dehydrogenase
VTDPHGEHRTAEVYLNGRVGRRPEYPVSYDDLKAAAEEELSPEARAYVAGGAGREGTMSENRRAFRRWRLVPRMLRDVADRDLSVEAFGRTLPLPFLLAPVGLQTLYHEEGELATARAAADLDVPMAVSTVSSKPLEDVADALGETTGWFQLYWSTDDELTDSFLERAEEAGYEAVVVTVDTGLTGWRERELSQATLPFFEGHGTGNYVTDDRFRETVPGDPDDVDDAARHLVDLFTDPGHDWDDFEALCGRTDLPVLVKGLVHPDDAVRAVEAGADGVVVSNHGGRQLDGSVGALDALPAVAEAVGDEALLVFDSGVRNGADVLRALALGADLVGLGRPYLYGLTLGGEEGVRAVLKNVRADLDLSLGLCGYADVSDVDRAAVVRSGESPSRNV